VKKPASTYLAFGFALILGAALLAASDWTALGGQASPCDEAASSHHEVASNEAAAHDQNTSCEPMAGCCCSVAVASGLVPEFAVAGRALPAPIAQPRALPLPPSHLTAPPSAPPQFAIL